MAETVASGNVGSIGGAGGSLRRSLGLTSLTFYGVGLILGAGIYTIIGQAAGVAGEALWEAFLVGSLAALLTGLSYAELATMFPRAGAEYVYLSKAWPDLPWLPGTVGWVLAIAGVATTATVALAFAGYASRFAPFSPWLTAVGLIVIVSLLNIIGISEASWANVLITLIEIGGLLALIAVGIRDPGLLEVFRTPPHAGVLSAAGLIFFAYLGFEDIANLAEEAVDPPRTIPRAILLSVAITTLLYVMVAAASVALLDPGKLAASPSPLADAMAAADPRLAGAMGGVALFATANTALITVTAGSRLVFGMARGGDAPPIFARTAGRQQMPAAAICLAGVGAVAFLPVGGVGVVGSVASLLALLAFGAVDAALIRLRFTRPELARPFRVPVQAGKVPLLPVLGLLVVIALIAQFSGTVMAIAAVALLTARLLQAALWGRSPAMR